MEKMLLNKLDKLSRKMRLNILWLRLENEANIWRVYNAV